ncbi:uncharacterized protein LOC114181524 isoform X2 [Vigna unguiculata]|uniref:uncharacterized protein LOC114181524 isoform X2 n=1 Tax=Vigna unguiculata TaxID=3917 RepID=UPI001016CACF|nr:uncharacterized protein LOC114181524 isoform X2 [Vigna unguiculata]
MIHTLFFLLYLLCSHVSLKVDGIQEDLELERQFDLINKPSMKSIHTKVGDIIDCIDIYKQPSFDHPLLKGHKLQRKPSFHNVIGESSHKNLRTKSIFGLSKDECPTGTVPILRTTKDDLIREKSMLNNHMLVQDVPGVHLAEVSLKPHFGPYYGVNGINSLYNPRLDAKFQISMSHLWVQNGLIESTNKISLGWHVIPELYGDYASHFYSSWTSDNYKKTGCYNIRCAGFVQTSKEIYLGLRITNVSVYGGPIYASPFSISQDPKTKNWWLSIENKFIGYFPIKLFSNMSSADEVGWGGRTRTRLGTHSPQMGSGHLPNDNIATHACYFRQVTIQDSSRRTRGAKAYETYSFSDNPNCYDVKYYADAVHYFGLALFFGGPGGNCGN